MFREEILENERRRTIYQFVDHHPGLHLRALQRRLDIPLSTLGYHLNYMVSRHIVYKENDGHYQRYYTVPLSNVDKELITLLRQKWVREIVLLVLTRHKIKYQELLDTLALPPSTLSLYLSRLIDHHLLQRHQIGRETIYTVTNEHEIMKCLITYQSSFLDRLIDNVIASWMNLSRDTQ
jgi:predicted transcriptional regulator